ncbi:WAP four-disulfide core domain protein 2-like [Vespa velutina]|uniref:WAP four-disulfide core domain protein 2-like n=1 Tax=Vespa velutina TaxID=202808 RepID=UPI001FB31484|nr:WAP four-disulfide core domain protein 2-like [Vespa velutina]
MKTCRTSSKSQTKPLSLSTCQRSVVTRRSRNSFRCSSTFVVRKHLTGFQNTKMASLSSSMLLLIILSTIAFGQQLKPGACPPPISFNIRTNLCNNDMDCSGSEKCCLTNYEGTICVKPITETVNVVKQGSCPIIPTGRWICTSTCRSDGDCRGIKKCCQNRCGALACQNPEPDYDPIEYDYSQPSVIFRRNRW